MRLRNWVIAEVTSGIILLVIGLLIKNDNLTVLGTCITMLPLFHNLINCVYSENKLEKQLRRDNKYCIGILCANCDQRNWLKIPYGTHISEFISGRPCAFCKCDLKVSGCSIT
jgi:hypothetical protein